MISVKKAAVVLTLFIQLGFASDNYYYKKNEKVTLTPNDTAFRASARVNYYINENGTVLGVSDMLLLKLKRHADLKKYLNEFNLTTHKSLGKNLYLLKSSDKNLVIDIANRLNEKDDVKYAHPDFIKKAIKR